MSHSFRAYLVLACALVAALAAGCGSVPPATGSAPTAAPGSEVRPDLGQYFGDLEGAFVLYDMDRHAYVRYNPERCATRYLPASTFKILNSLIGLETQVIADEDYVIPWDGTSSDIPAWNQDHTLKTAIRDSAVWYYQELARRVGPKLMGHYVAAAAYGNGDISGEIDTFWLEGGLRISADEQVAFLQRLYANELPFSRRALDIVKTIIVLEQTETYRLSGKTGTVARVEPRVSWFVGYLETDGSVYFFATNISSPSAGGSVTGDQARQINKSILQALGLLSS